MSTTNLNVTVGPLKFKNPIIAASGTFGYGKELDKIINMNKLGGFITKTITLKPRQGNPPPRICEVPSGIINSIGLENPGLDYFLDNYMPYLTRLKTISIVSIGAENLSELPVLAKKLSNKKGVDALEINLSCPNLSKNKQIAATSPTLTKTIIKKIRKAAKVPIIAKLSPNVTDIVTVAKAAYSSGADIISLINTLSALVIDWRSRRPFLGNTIGGLSGPAIKPVALRMVWEVASKTKAPIIGMGGIMKASDVLEFLIAGASAVGIGTGNIVDPRLPLKTIGDLPKLLKEEKIKNIRHIINSLKT